MASWDLFRADRECFPERGSTELRPLESAVRQVQSRGFQAERKVYALAHKRAGIEIGEIEG